MRTIKSYRADVSNRFNFVTMFGLAWGSLLLCVSFSAEGVRAQQATAAGATAAATPALSAPAGSALKTDASSDKDGRYRIGPGDMLDVRFVKNPDLSRDNVRVDNRGMIRMPMLEDDIQAACLTEGELAQSLAKLYLKYKKNPHIDVFVKEYNSKPVAVIGAVIKPSQFQIQREVRLLELLTRVDGPSERAGGLVQIVHTGTPTSCGMAGNIAPSQQPAPPESEGVELSRNLMLYNLDKTLKGDPRENPIVRPGDVVSIPEAEQAYVVGNVLRPGIITLKEPVTLSRAIAMSGGLMPDTKSEQVKIIRQVPGSLEKTEMIVNLKAINKRQSPDVALRAGDVVEVQTAGGKRLLRSLIGAVVPTVGQLPIQIIR